MKVMKAINIDNTIRDKEGIIFKGGFFTLRCVTNAAIMSKAIPIEPINANCRCKIPMRRSKENVIFNMPTRSLSQPG